MSDFRGVVKIFISTGNKERYLVNKKIFISVIAIGNIYKKPSLEDIMVIIYSNLSRYTDQP